MPAAPDVDQIRTLLAAVSEAVPLPIQRRLDGLLIDEYADMCQRNSPEMLFDLMGFGEPAGPLEQFRADYLKGGFGPSLRLLADAVGLPLDDVRAGGELATAARDTTIASGVIEARYVAAQRITISSIRNGQTLPRFRASWYCTRELEPNWDLHDTGWHISVAGDAPAGGRPAHADPDGADGRDHPRLHRQSRGQRGALCLRGRTRHRDHRGSAALRAQSGLSAPHDHAAPPHRRRDRRNGHVHSHFQAHTSVSAGKRAGVSGQYKPPETTFAIDTMGWPMTEC